MGFEISGNRGEEPDRYPEKGRLQRWEQSIHTSIKAGLGYNQLAMRRRRLRVP
jgi:hypothetical protein